MERYNSIFNKLKESNLNEDYNGWSNYETWNVFLWVVQDEGLYHEMVHMKPFNARSAERWVKNVYPNGTPDMESHHMSYRNVDWQEIADAFNEQ